MHACAEGILICNIDALFAGTSFNQASSKAENYRNEDKSPSFIMSAGPPHCAGIHTRWCDVDYMYFGSMFHHH